MLEALDAAATRRWAAASLAALGRVREEIDALNVYPVPDGDTGTNLYLTVEAACAAALALHETSDLAAVTSAFARGALLGARGNSGVIVAQMMCAWADVLGPVGSMDAEAARRAFQLADEQARAAVAEPVEGTILSVSRAAAVTARATAGTLAEVVSASTQAAREALERTPEQLETLRRAGVVDAGGYGLVVLLETLEDVVHDRTPRARGAGHVRHVRRHPAAAGPEAGDDGHVDDALGQGGQYEVMYLLEASGEAVPGLRRALNELGDSLVVVGGDGLWHVHVHVDNPGAAIEAGVSVGRPRQIRVENLRERAGDSPAAWSHSHPAHPAHPHPAHLHPAHSHPAHSDPAHQVAAIRPTIRPAGGPPGATGGGLVACAAGPGLAELFRLAGAVVVPTGPGLRPSTGEILAAVRSTAAARVAVLPNDPDSLAVAAAAAGAARGEGIKVTVLPTRAQVQGLAAAAVHDPGRTFDADLVEMTAAAGATRHGAVTVAAKEAITMAGPCQVGDALGVVQGDFAVVGNDLAVVACEVVDRLLSGGGELLTLVRGRDTADVPAGPLADAVVEHVRRRRLDVEITVHDGGQERYPLLLGVE